MKNKNFDLILDRINKVGYARTVYEIYCEHNAFTLSNITLDEFEDIFLSLFDDELDDLINNKLEINQLSLEDAEDYHERVEIIYHEVIESALINYTFKQFLEDISESEWASIITNCHESYLCELDDYIFENYKLLKRNGHIIKG